MPYLSYITIHYQNARSDHANATKAKKYIQHYRYKKSASKSETTENERLHKIPKKNILFFGAYNFPE